MNPNIIVTPDTVTTAGLVTYWRLSGGLNRGLNRARLLTAWTDRDLTVDRLPKPPGLPVALGRAVRMEAAPRVLVRPLREDNSWAIVRENAGDVLTYETLCTVAFKDGPVFTRGEATPTEYEPMVARIRANYDEKRGELASEDVSSWLVRMVKYLNAVPLRDTGGIYFIPRQNVDLWTRVAAALESVSSHAVFRIPAMKNDEAIRAITDAITQEAAQAVQTMHEKLAKLGSRALKNRREECDVLLAKIAEYDDLLGTQLKVREQVSGLQSAIAAALLVADADEAA